MTVYKQDLLTIFNSYTEFNLSIFIKLQQVTFLRQLYTDSGLKSNTSIRIIERCGECCDQDYNSQDLYNGRGLTYSFSEYGKTVSTVKKLDDKVRKCFSRWIVLNIMIW